MRERPPKRRGDRKDAYLVRDTDPMHALMARALDERTDNEAVMTEQIELTAAEEFLRRKNEEGPEYKYTLFHLFLAATAKVFALRPKMNWFLQNGHLYERQDIVLTFTGRRKFTDHGGEFLMLLKMDENDGAPSPLEQVHEKVCREVYKVRSEEKVDDTTDFMSLLTRLPDFVLKLVVKYLRWADRTGRMPADISKINPYEASVFLSNLGSIKMSADYHHLSNFGTNSVFIIIGEKKPTPFFDETGSVTMRPALELGITVDERIADGFYFIRSIRLLRYLMAHPELLERPLYEPVEWEE